MTRKLVGFFEELCHGLEGGGSLVASIAGSACDDEEKIVEYLNAGNLSVASACTVSDVLQAESNIVICGLHILTDGVWEWRTDLSYYVEKYHVRLPDDFVYHMRESGWRVPEPSDADFT